MTVRELARHTKSSLATAQKVLSHLKEEGLLIGDSTNPAIISAGAVQADACSPKRIGVVFTHLASPFFSALAQSVQAVAQRRGYQALVASTEYRFDREKEVIDGFLDIGVQGLLIAPGLDNQCVPFYRDLLARNVPLVFISRQHEEVDTDFVVVNNFAGGSAMAQHLLSGGYKSFGYISFGPRLKRDERLAGFRMALSDGGVSLADEYVLDDDGGDIANGYNAMKRMMALPKPPRCVFAFSDLLAIGAIRYCQENHISIPGTVAIAGFDDLPESSVTSPPLTTVAYPVDSMASLAVHCLLDKASGGPGRLCNRIMLEASVVVRQSTDPYALSYQPAKPAADVCIALNLHP